MNFTKTEMNRLRLSGLLHDIGKIGIRDELLLSKEKLTEEEHYIINNRSYTGCRIRNSSPNFRDIALWVWCHHEKIDGAGYSRKIKGNNIPIFSRIISVTDSYDAMTSWRVYKPILNQEEAIKEPDLILK